MNDGFSLSQAGLSDDPVPLYARSRSLGGVCPFSDPAPHIGVFHEADVREILCDDETWSSRHGPGLAYEQPHRPSGVLVSSDPPLHTAQRAILAPIFRPGAISRYEGQINELADELVRGFAPRGQADVVTDLAMPLSLTVVCWLLGTDPGRIHDYWSWVLPLAQGVTSPQGSFDRRVIAAYHAFYEHFNDHINQRRAALRDNADVDSPDVLTKLMRSERDGQPLTQAELLGFCQFLLVAGSVTTTMLIGNLIHRLMEHPAQLAKLVVDRALIGNAIEESLRYDAPMYGLFRTNTRDVTLRDQAIPQHSKVLVMFAAANHDPTAWEEPGRFDIDRDIRLTRRNYAFGHGIHYCLGAPLARMEAAAALGAVLTHLSRIRSNGEPVRVRAEILHGFERLPVAWQP